MKINFTYINTIMMLIGIVLVIIKSVELFQLTNQKDVILKSMITKKNKLTKALQACEVIAGVKNRTENDGNLNRSENKLLNKGYWKQKNEIDILKYKLVGYCSHTAYVVYSNQLFRDKISKNIYLGNVENDILIPCDAHSILINKELMPYYRGTYYRVSTKQNLEIEYQRYSLNYLEGKIDTARTIRKIDKKELHNIRW